MPNFRFALAALISVALPNLALAQSNDDKAPRLSLELNTIYDVESACRLTFVTRNQTGTTIDSAVFEAVIFDKSAGVASLSLFDFRDLPADKPRVRQFDVTDMVCDNIGQVLINGASSCVIDGIDSQVCNTALTVNSRISVEMLG